MSSSTSLSSSSNRANTAVDTAAGDGQLATSADLLQLLEAVLPQENIVYAFGYGSGVLSQQIMITERVKDMGHDDDNNNDNINTSVNNNNNMIDMIVVVDSAYKFHQANLQRNPHHYPASSLSEWLCFQNDPAAKATWLQRHDVLFHNSNPWFRNPKVYFVVSSSKEGACSLKYGVIQVDDLVQDLVDWKYLYLAGRMHKPTVEIVNRNNNAGNNNMLLVVEKQLNYNLPAALSASLLLLSNNQNNTSSSSSTPHEEEEVYSKIASLSYTGDFRMAVGAEDPRKITKLVQSPGQLGRFQTLYKDAAEQLQRQGILSITSSSSSGSCSSSSSSSSSSATNTDTITSTTTNTTEGSNDHDGAGQVEPQPLQWTWDTSPAARAHLWSRLPKSLQQPSNDSFSSSSSELLLLQQQQQQQLQKSLVSIVAPAARYQSIKGLATVRSWRTSVFYAARKLSKGLFK